MCTGGMMLNSYISISRNKLFVWSVTLTLLLFMAFHLMYFETFSREVLKNDLSAKRFHFIEKNGNTIKIAAIGTSHTGDSMQIDEDYFINYARSGSWDPMVAYAKASQLLHSAVNLKVLLLEVDHICLLSYDPILHTVAPEQYLYLLKHVKKPLYEKNRLYDNEGKISWLLSLQSDVAPVIHRKYFQSYLMGRENKKEVISPWSTLTSKEKIESAKKRTHSYRIDTPSYINKAVRDYYVEAIREAKKKGVKVYLLFNPQSKEYFAEIDEENNILVNTFVSELAKKDNVSVLDYRYYFKSDESFFENQDHVNKKGSEVISREVVKVIKNDL